MSTTETPSPTATLSDEPVSRGRSQTQQKYICDCGYDAKRKISRLIKHQQQHCTKRKVTAPFFPCPVCNKEFTYDGLKSHLLPFTKTLSRGTYNKEHAIVNIDDHKKHLEEVKSRYGPKKFSK